MPHSRSLLLLAPLALLLTLLPARRAEPCSPARQESWQLESPGKQARLSLTAEGRARTYPLRLEVRQGSGWASRWEIELDHFIYADALVWDSGDHVVLFDQNECRETCRQVVLLGKDGQELGAWSILDQLDEEERQWVPQSMCGIEWKRGAALVGTPPILELEVGQAGNLPPMYGPGVTLKMRIDPVKVALDRDPPLKRPSVAELITRYEAASELRERMHLFMLLAMKSQLSTMRGDEVLRTFWRGRLGQGEEREQRFATEAYLQVATDAELIELCSSVPAADSLALRLLESLEARLPDHAGAYALMSLEKQAGPELLRQRAFSLLTKAEEPTRRRALDLALGDPFPKVRTGALMELKRIHPGEEGCRKLAPLLRDTDPEVARMARGTLVRSYLGKTGDHHRACFATLPRKGKAGAWGGWAILLGGAQELAGRPARALPLYRRGVKALAALPPDDRRWGASLELLMEGRLRLAALAAAAGRRAEARRQAEAVLADERGTRTMVDAPRPTHYAGTAPVEREPPAARRPGRGGRWARATHGGRRQAGAVAKEILEGLGSP